MKKLFFAFCVVLAVVGCRNEEELLEQYYDNDEEEYNPEDADTEAYPDWSELTHSKNVSPNFDLVFAEGKVHRIDITMTAENWNAMWDDLDDNMGSSSSGPGGGMGGNMGGGSVSVVDFTPIWVPCTITYEDTDWYEVGVRFKGNSSLSSAYSSNVKKLSMKLDFDEFEDDYPALKNQRFYGFKQLNLNNNYNDNSFMREKVVSDLFREFGLAAARTAFCEVWLDYGSGSKYFGLYTLLEEVDDTVIDYQFADGSGNLYKPEDDAAQFNSGSYDTEEFNLKTNLTTCDYSDVRALYDAINASGRTSNQASWMSGVESAFDVDVFMKWLAVNSTVQNWDTYGNMAHNYFIYNNPSTGQLTWIPWDNNEALQSGSGQYSSIEPSSMSRVSSSWPLISYLIAIDEYKALYDDYLRDFIDNYFTSDIMTARYTTYSDLIKQYAYDEVSGYTFLSSDASFDAAITTLKSHVSSRYTTVNSYLK